MIFSDHERKIIIAAMQWAAMQHEKAAKDFAAMYQKDKAARAAAFSGECARIADLLMKAH